MPSCPPKETECPSYHPPSSVSTIHPVVFWRSRKMDSKIVWSFLIECHTVPWHASTILVLAWCCRPSPLPHSTGSHLSEQEGFGVCGSAGSTWSQACFVSSPCSCHRVPVTVPCEVPSADMRSCPDRLREVGGDHCLSCNPAPLTMGCQ